MVWDSLQPAVNWLGDSAFAQWLGQSQARIAALFVVHLVGLTAQLAREIAPWWMAGLALMLVSGSLIFTGGAVSYFEGEWFRRKMTLLIGALIFSFTWFRAVINADEGQF